MGRWCAIWVTVAACGSGGGGAKPDATTADGTPDGPPPVLEDVHYYGRFDAQHRFAWPGSHVVTRFDGTAISVDLQDAGQDYFEVTIDGVAQTPLHPGSGRATYMLAAGLAAGPHDLVLARRTESFYGASTLFGFPGATLIATPRATRLIELIGDSITCGYGVLGVGPTCNFSAATEAEPHAWGTFAATALGAEHASIAYSGFGMYRGYGGSATDTLPTIYGRTFADDSASTWEFSYAPDVIAIDLGTNDFAQGDPGQAFVTAYVAFVQTLRAKFPSARILLATSPMLADTFPVGAMHRTKLRGYLDTIAATLADPGVSVVDIAEQLAADGWGCDYHPSETTQHAMADTLAAAIRNVTGW